MNLLGRLNLWQKLGLIVGTLLIPTILATAFYIRTVSSAIDVTRDELAGARYLRPLGSLHRELLTHRGELHAVIGGDNARRSAASAARAEIDRLIAELDPVDAELNPRFATSGSWRAITDAWSRLKQRGDAFTAQQSREDHDAILDRMLDLNMKVWMESTLSLDPEATAYYLIIAATDKVPNAMNHVGGIRMMSERGQAAEPLSQAEEASIRMHRQEVALDLKTMRTELGSVAPQSQAVQKTIMPALDAASQAYASFDTELQRQAVSNATPAGAVVTAALGSLSAATYDAVKQELEDRLASQSRSLYINVTALSGLLLFALALGAVTSRSITRPMAHAISIFGSIAKGRYDNRIQQGGTDETGQVLRALAQMQERLQQLKEEEANAAATVGGRISAALEHATSSMLVADSELKIIYFNQTFREIMQGLEARIRTDLPGFALDTLVGSDVVVLYPHPSEAHATLAGLRDRWREEITFADRTFRIDANPVFGESGERIGTVLEWTDRTEQAGVEREMHEILEAVLAGSLDQRVSERDKSGFMGVMSANVNKLVDNMAEMIAQVKEASAEVHRGAQEIASGTSNLSQRTEQQSSSLAETASSMEQMTSTVKQNADHAGQANELAAAARDDAVKGGTVVTDAVRAMQDISDSSRRISDIIAVINEIAFQTNLLALNAAVEAARAGEQGRGFAVVAGEVRSLAGRSATAAKEIKQLIQDSEQKVRDGALLVTQSGQTLEQIVASVKKVSSIVADIAAASREQSAGIEQVNRAVAQMEEITQQNAALVEQATTSSKDMAEAASRLNQMMSRYRLESAPAALTNTLQREPIAKANRDAA